MAHRIGIIGLGIMGQRMLGAMATHSGFSVAAAWDAAPEAMAWLLREHKEIAPAASAAALAGRRDLDGLYIASPPVSHPGYVNLAWDNGKAAFCEKPLAVSVDASQALVQRQAAERCIAAINFPFALGTAARKLADAVASGALGVLQSIDIEVAFAAWPRDWQQAGRWLSEREEGGFVREVVSHFLFLAQRLAGPLAVLDARPTYPADGRMAESAIEARLTAGGIPVTLHGAVGTTSVSDHNSFTVTGTQGACRLHGWINLARRDRAGWAEVDFGPGPPLRQRGAMAQLDALGEMLDGKPHPLATLAEGLAVQICVEELLRQR
jgi:predicted dehydrogenase